MWNLAALLLLTTSAHAHDQWNNGKPVEDWIKRECCANEVPESIDPRRVHRVMGVDWMTGQYGVIGYKVEASTISSRPSAGMIVQMA